MKAALQDKLRILRSSTSLIVLFMGGGCIYNLPYLSSFFYIPMKDAMHPIFAVAGVGLTLLFRYRISAKPVMES